MSRNTKQKKFGKVKYKVGFLGCLSCSWPHGADITDGALRNLVYGNDKHVVDDLPRLSITVDKKELKITREVLSKRGKKKVPLPSVPVKNVLFAARGTSQDIEGTVGCIFYGYNTPPGAWPLTVHGFLFESVKSANKFLCHLERLIDTSEHREILFRRVKEMLESGWFVPRGQEIQKKDNLLKKQASGAGDGKRGLRRTELLEADSEFAQMASVERGHNMYLSNKDFCGGDQLRGPEPGRLPRTVLIPNGVELSPHACRYLQIHGLITQGMEYHLPSERRFQKAQRSCNPSFEPHTDEVPVEPATSFDSDRHFSVDASDHRIISRFHVESAIAAELKSKLSQGPILLPPKDYDTFSRTRGNMAGIEARKCLSSKIVRNTPGEH